ncbi:MAG TPA: ATP phosphoribosyltransferase [Thermoanaerobaculia bacterium]
MRIAISKGRLQNDSLAAFAAAGYDIPSEIDLRSRKLVFERGGVEWIFVKDADVPVYVDNGAADAGIAGLDQILEHACSALQPFEFAFGRCRMMLIAAPGAPRLTKIATKYPRIARQYVDARQLHAEIVPLAGSVELAAVLRLTSHVVDLVETGETVRVHNLEIQDLVAEISPRLIVSKTSYRTNGQQIGELIARIERACHPERSDGPGGSGGALIEPPAPTGPSLTLGMTKE